MDGEGLGTGPSRGIGIGVRATGTGGFVDRDDSAGPGSAPLSGYVVVELSTGIAGAYCTKMLSDAGADVVKVEPPRGDPLRLWSASGARIEPGSDGALFTFLAGGKSGVLADPGIGADLGAVHALLRTADAVVWSRGSAVAEHPSLHPEQIRRTHPHLTVTAITPFGLDGPWSDRPATEFTVQAWSGGIIGLGRGAPDRAPVHIGGRVGEWLTGATAAAAVLASRARTLVTGDGELVDVSMLETQVLSLTYHPVSFFEGLGRPFRTERRLTVPGVATAQDGLVALGCGTAQQWFDLCVMVGHPEWIDEDSPLSITEQANKMAPEIRAWIAERTTEEILDLASALRIPNGPVGNGGNVTGFDQYRSRGSFTVNPRGDFVQPGRPYRIEPGTLPDPQPSPALGEHTHDCRRRSETPRPVRDRAPSGAGSRSVRPFGGLRVLDMTSFWAGPSCTHALAMLGADVIHLESASRPDGTRLIAGVPVSEDDWWEKSPIFSGLNTGKRSLALDFRTERGREVLRRLIATCDVIVENYTPRVLDQLGLDFGTVRALRPDAILVRMPGFGLDGPWRDNPAFAYVIEDSAGLSWLTGHPDQNPVEPYSVGDPNAGVHALVGLLVALEQRRRTGVGALVEAPMVDAALNIAAEQVIEYSAYGTILQRDGNRGPVAAPQNLYRTDELDEFGRPDCWVAVAVETDEQWLFLRSALGDPGWAADPELGTAAGRRRHHDLLDEQLARWCRGRTADEIVGVLWDAGVPVAKVMQPHRQTEIPQLAHRGFFEELDHPVFGRARHSTMAARFSEAPAVVHTRRAPLLGEHNREILAELGLDDREIAELEDDGVLGRTPVW